MLRAPNPEPLVFTIIIAIIIVVLPGRFTATDADADGYSDVRELVAQCDLFDAESVPMCADADGDGIGEWPLIAPRCDMGEGLAPCA